MTDESVPPPEPDIAHLPVLRLPPEHIARFPLLIARLAEAMSVSPDAASGQTCQCDGCDLVLVTKRDGVALARTWIGGEYRTWWVSTLCLGCADRYVNGLPANSPAN